MQPLSPMANTYPDCYLQIRRDKQTIFTDVAETTTVRELKQIIANILKTNPEIIRLIAKGAVLDIDGKHLLECGMTTKNARSLTPFQFEFLLKLDDRTYETEEIVSYTTENSSSIDEQQQIDISIDSR